MQLYDISVQEIERMIYFHVCTICSCARVLSASIKQALAGRNYTDLNLLHNYVHAWECI